MNNNQNWKGLGEQIRNSVTDAINTGDFSRLNRLVADSVNSALQEAKTEFAQKGIQYNQIKTQQDGRTVYHYEKKTVEHTIPAPKPAPAPAPQVKHPFKRIGNVSGVLYSVFGGILLGLSILTFLVMGILTLVFRAPVFAILTGVFGFGIIGAARMIGLGGSIRGRLTRAERYLRLCGGKTYVSLAELAKATGKSLRYVRKDIKKMIAKGLFPQGHLDEQETCFILDDVTYGQYTQSAEAFRMRQQMLEQKKEEPTLSEQIQTEKNKQQAQFDAMLGEGRSCIRRLRDLNDRIPDENLSADLFRLENLLNEIFDNLKDHPEQMNRMNKLMDYYLPTTIKLVEAYEDFGRVSNPGEDIRNAKKEIEKTLGIINDAFSELQNNLFQEAAFDAATDAQVLQSMLAREGLTKETAFVYAEKRDEE